MKKIIILGKGGHASVLIDALSHRQDIEIVALLSQMEEDQVLNYSPREVQLVNGVGAVTVSKQRQQLFSKFKELGYYFFSVIHPTAYIAKGVSLGEGVQIMAGSIIQPKCNIGDNVIINTRASIDHDCRIDAHVHVAPGVVMSGQVEVGEASHVGAGATIIQGIKLGEKCLVAAGAVVVKDVFAEHTVRGVPARSEVIA